MLFVLSTLGLVYVTLFSDPEQILDDYHLVWAVLPFLAGLVVGASSLLVSAASGVLPVSGGFADDLFALVAGPFGTPWWYYVVSTVVMFAVHSLTKHNEVAAVRDLREEVADAKATLDDVEARVEDGDAERAQELLDDLEPRLRSMRRTATEYDLTELSGEISTLQQKRRLQFEELGSD